MTQVFAIEEFTTSPAIVAVYVSQPAFFLDEDAKTYRATVKCYDGERNFVGNKEVTFTQEEYDGWGTDDEYIYNLLHEKLGTKRTFNNLIDLNG